MLIIPAIDLKDGACVRLRQGRMEDSTVFSDDPVSMAAKWVEGGCRRLHLVDLNGAFEGQPVNGEVVTAIAKRYPNLPIQIGVPASGSARGSHASHPVLQWRAVNNKKGQLMHPRTPRGDRRHLRGRARWILILVVGALAALWIFVGPPWSLVEEAPQEPGDAQAQARAEKLLTFMDRLVVHSPRSTRGGRGKR